MTGGVESWDESLPLGDTRFFDLVEMPRFSGGSLEAISGWRASDPPYLTSLIEEHERAWRKPFADLTCADIEMFVGQRSALEWLARPVLDLLAARPDTFMENYPGDLAMLTLQAAPDMLAHEPARFRAWLVGDFAWAEQAFRFSRGLRRRFDAALAEARALAGP